LPSSCDICGKSPMYGHNVSHSKRRTNRRFMPNVHSRRLSINGQRVRVNICTRCLRSLQKTPA